MLTGAYRATEHASTGCSPNLLFMGREVSIPLDVLAGTPPRQRTFYNAASYGQWLTRSMNIAHQYARRVLEKSATRQKRGYHLRNKLRRWTPSVGEWVYFYYPPYSRYKLGSPWIGPYVVVKKLQARTWLIQAGPEKPSRVVHEDNLKPVQGRLQNEDNWVKQRLKQNAANPDPEDAYQSPSDTDEEELVEPSTDPVSSETAVPTSPVEKSPEESRTQRSQTPDPKEVAPPSRDDAVAEQPPSKSISSPSTSEKKPEEAEKVPQESSQENQKNTDKHLEESQEMQDISPDVNLPSENPEIVENEVHEEIPVDEQIEKEQSENNEVVNQETSKVERTPPHDEAMTNEKSVREESQKGSEVEKPPEKPSEAQEAPRKSTRERSAPKKFDPCAPAHQGDYSSKPVRSVFDWFTHYFDPG